MHWIEQEDCYWLLCLLRCTYRLLCVLDVHSGCYVLYSYIQVLCVVRVVCTCAYMFLHYVLYLYIQVAMCCRSTYRLLCVVGVHTGCYVL